MDLGMVIRTIIFDADGIQIGIGGGITADSVPSEELEETRIKAKALLEVLRLSDPWS
jgi:anthranilate/para-aminobenzoate synthase component I